MTHHEMVEESVLPSVFLQHPECLHPEQAKNPVTCAAKDLSKGACEEDFKKKILKRTGDKRKRPGKGLAFSAVSVK